MGPSPFSLWSYVGDSEFCVGYFGELERPSCRQKTEKSMASKSSLLILDNLEGEE